MPAFGMGGHPRQIRYRAGYKYQLARTYSVDTGRGLSGSEPVGNDFVALQPDGTLVVSKGYAWDGPSGPTFDTPSFMRGSLVHDALYQLIREGHLPESPARELADGLLRQLCLEDGMGRLRAWWVWKAVRRFAGPAADPSHRKPVLSAPDLEGLAGW